jgi:hypothetical protein
VKKSTRNPNHRFRLSDNEIKLLGLHKQKSGSNRYYLNASNRQKLAEIRGVQGYVKDELPSSTKVDLSEDNASYEYNGTLSIQDEETAIEFFNIDLDKWMVDRMVCNSWDVNMFGGVKTNYQVKLFLKRKPRDVGDFVDLVQSIMDQHEIPKFYIQKKKSKAQSPDNCEMINIFDAHIDKMCYLGKSTLEKNISTFEDAFEDLLSKAIYEGSSTFLFPFGNDFWNTNVGMESTKKGTPQKNVAIADIDGYELGTEVYMRCVDKAAQYCNVHLIEVPGNHDEDKVRYAGVMFKNMYKNVAHISVDNRKELRKYYQWGKCLFGFAHGDKEKNKVNSLPLYMAEEQKTAWAETLFREFYLGDIHHKQEYKFLRGKDHLGVMVRFLRSVGMSTDQWHHDFGWIGVPKTAELFVWHKEDGMKDNYLKNIK